MVPAQWLNIDSVSCTLNRFQDDIGNYGSHVFQHSYSIRILLAGHVVFDLAVMSCKW